MRMWIGFRILREHKIEHNKLRQPLSISRALLRDARRLTRVASTSHALARALKLNSRLRSAARRACIYVYRVPTAYRVYRVHRYMYARNILKYLRTYVRMCRRVVLRHVVPSVGSHGAAEQHAAWAVSSWLSSFSSELTASDSGPSTEVIIVHFGVYKNYR